LQAFVEIKEGVNVEASFSASASLKFGKSPTKKAANAIIINVEGVSGSHGVFHSDGIEDSGSTYGTFVYLSTLA
jgi:hypothetical protein